MRLQYPPDIRIIQVPCTGKVDILHLLTAFEEGADGVFVAGCLEGGCHFIEGNLYAKKRVNYTRKMLAELGLARGQGLQDGAGAVDRLDRDSHRQFGAVG